MVRATGGMVGTVFDHDYSRRPPSEGNGYVFHETDNLAIESALGRALGLGFAYPGDSASSWSTPCGPTIHGPGPARTI